MSQLVPPSFLFRWSFPVTKVTGVPHRSGRLLDLPDTCRLPTLSELDAKKDFADVRLCWNENGFGLSVDVRGRSRPPHCSADSLRDSEGLSVWIDTRKTQGVHRATKFCHHFWLMPSGHETSDGPVVAQLPLARAREDATPIDVSQIKIQSDVQKDGYWLDAWIPASALVGYDPSTTSQMGFYYILRDLQLGAQTLAMSTEFPIDVDPSLWQTLELVDV